MLAILWWLPFCFSFIVTGPVYLVILYFITKQATQYTAMIEVNRNMIYDIQAKHIGYFKWFPFIYFVINLFPIAREVCSVGLSYDNAALWIVSTAFLGLQGGIVALVATLDPHTRQTLRWNSFKAAWNQNVMCKKHFENYPLLRPELTESINN